MDTAAEMILERLDRGELVRVLADVDACRLFVDDFREAWEMHRRGWFGRLLARLVARLR